MSPQIKKEYIAGYFFFIMFFVVFLSGFILHLTGHEHQSRMAVAVAVMLLGATMLIGIYSNVKNYGYFWMWVRRSDSDLPISELNKRYAPVKKGTARYRMGITICAMLASAICLFGLYELVKEIRFVQ